MEEVRGAKAVGAKAWTVVAMPTDNNKAGTKRIIIAVGWMDRWITCMGGDTTGETV